MLKSSFPLIHTCFVYLVYAERPMSKNTLNSFPQAGTVCMCVSVLIKITEEAATAGVSVSFVLGVPSSEPPPQCDKGGRSWEKK